MNPSTSTSTSTSATASTAAQSGRRPGYRPVRATRSRTAGRFTLLRADAWTDAAAPRTAGRLTLLRADAWTDAAAPRTADRFARRRVAWDDVASNSSRLTAESAPGARRAVSYSRISGSESAPTTLAMLRMLPRA